MHHQVQHIECRIIGTGMDRKQEHSELWRVVNIEEENLDTKLMTAYRLGREVELISEAM